MGWARSGRASPRDCAARRSRWPRVAPIPPACGTRGLASTRPSIQYPAQNPFIGIDAAVAQEGPVTADLFNPARIAFDDEGLLAVVRALRQHLSERIGYERAAPELEPMLRRSFIPDAVH